MYNTFLFTSVLYIACTTPYIIIYNKTILFKYINLFIFFFFHSWFSTFNSITDSSYVIECHDNVLEDKIIFTNKITLP